MADRRRQIELLLATRFDHLWFPAGALRTQAGLAPSERVTCPDCDRQEPGWRVERRGGVVRSRVPCETCGGHVTKTGKAKPGRGVVAIDGMDASRKPVGSADTASSQPKRTVKCDGCQDLEGNPTGVIRGGRCPYCQGVGTRDLHVFDLRLDTHESGGVDALTSSIWRRDQLGSYHQLDLALSGISRHVNKPPEFFVVTVNADRTRRLLDDLYLTETSRLERLSMFDQALVELGMAYIEWRMPDPIRVPADVVANRKIRAGRPAWVKGTALNRHERARRDQQIVRWEREGKPRGWIGQQVGLNDRQLREIINGRKATA